MGWNIPELVLACVGRNPRGHEKGLVGQVPEQLQERGDPTLRTHPVFYFPASR